MHAVLAYNIICIFYYQLKIIPINNDNISEWNIGDTEQNERSVVTLNEFSVTI